MERFKNIRSVTNKKFNTLDFTGEFLETLGAPEASGLWLIYGAEKMGKTTFALQLARQLAAAKKVLYVSAEQGFDKDFVSAVKKEIGMSCNGRILFTEYVSIEELKAKLATARSAGAIIIDNATMYADELKYRSLCELLELKSKLFILIAHEENGAPYTAAAKMAKRLAKRIIRVEGNKAFIDGRTQGGTITINEEKAQLFWGTEIIKN